MFSIKNLAILLAIFNVTHSLTLDQTNGCDSTTCILPDCLCMNTTPPMGLNLEEIPQMVFMTFDDAVSNWMYPTYEKIFGNRTNPNGCDISMTFFVTHLGTNYQLVNEFFNRGHEIASHSVSHKDDYPYWMNNSIAFWEREAGRQREIITTYSNIPMDQIQGFRTPYLQTGGDATFTALQNLGINFDSSLSTKNFMDPPIWPFTMDYGVTHECMVPPCSVETHPGLWDIPVINFQSGENGTVCNTPDFLCFPSYANLTASEVFDFFIFNYERYNKTRAPFNIYQHIYWLANSQEVLQGFLQFIDFLLSLDHVYFVPVSKGIEWIRNPLTLAQMTNNDVFGCDPSSNNREPVPCPEPQVCYYPESVPGGEQNMGSCVPCPSEYPWLDV
ncbi:hypothetical protein DAPPUDRAFT_191866 [Daphnia pulex]|uniref:NodB homology domain-containing protein n=1 Tax=Daphnia pulex TaxID=6669 RepID=E9FXF9_DAPPU|nr:hypothetical protein DAPPUDRAFT_191866 [Daphnia pulex]|eukprot:EFX88071.1 hypothetical protein DAPPUDRAFT_191866 [Daphnia pulex]